MREGELIKENVDGEDGFFLPEYYMDEKNIARRLISLNSSSMKTLFYKRVYEDIYSMNNITLADKQKEAIKSALENNITVIIFGSFSNIVAFYRRIEYNFKYSFY